MLYRYTGNRGVVLPHGIGVKQYNKDDIIESSVPLSCLGVPEGHYELIPFNKEEPVIKQEIAKKEFEINEAKKKLEEKKEDFDNQLQDMKNFVKKMEDEKKQIESSLVKETKPVKESVKASKPKKEEAK